MEEKESGGHGVWIAAVSAIILYVFFPMLLALPLALLEKAGRLPNSVGHAAELFFLPLKKLDDHFLPYHRLIEFERQVMLRAIGDPT